MYPVRTTYTRLKAIKIISFRDLNQPAERGSTVINIGERYPFGKMLGKIATLKIIVRSLNLLAYIEFTNSIRENI